MQAALPRTAIDTLPTKVKERWEAVSQADASQTGHVQGPLESSVGNGACALRYLAPSALNQDLGHVNDVAQGLNVISLPAPDGLRQDLQLQLLPFPYFLTLRLRSTEHRQKKQDSWNLRFWPYCFVSYFLRQIT